MTTLEKLRADIAMDADLCMEGRLHSLTSDAVALAMRLDAVVAMLEAEITLGVSDKSPIRQNEGFSRLISAREIHGKAVAIAEDTA